MEEDLKQKHGIQKIHLIEKKVDEYDFAGKLGRNAIDGYAG